MVGQYLKSSRTQNLLIDSYRLVHRSGILRSSIGSALFSAAYFFYKGYEDDLLQLLRRYPQLVRDGNVLDIGANIGYTAQVLARALDPGYVVYAFEPEPFNYRLLQRNARKFAGKIISRQSAVGAQNGEVQLWLNTRHPADHRVITEQFQRAHAEITSISVPMVSVDTFLKDKPGPVSFIKIDVQGFEQAVCEGMRITLQRNPNLSILLEYAPSGMRDLGFDPVELINFLGQYGFTCHHVCEKSRLRRGLPERLGDSEYADVLFSRHTIPSQGI